MERTTCSGNTPNLSNPLQRSKTRRKKISQKNWIWSKRWRNVLYALKLPLEFLFHVERTRGKEQDQPQRHVQVDWSLLQVWWKCMLYSIQTHSVGHSHTLQERRGNQKVSIEEIEKGIWKANEIIQQSSRKAISKMIFISHQDVWEFSLSICRFIIALFSRLSSQFISMINLCEDMVRSRTEQ